ncbi:MAG: polysaccharide deacetylase family protein [Ruminococcaceae bacterium]|nr:polysaccharide deacetylase family protein [Oscillospiraceae bacterium]
MKGLIAVLLSLTLSLGEPVYQNDSERQIYCSAPNDEKKIALTFDDGPHPIYTEQILSILREYGIKATFFTIGENVKYYPDIFEMVLNDGHEIGNHTFSHPHMRSENTNELMDEICMTENLFRQKGAANTKLFRPPEGVCSDTVCATAKQMGYAIILWTVDTKDWSHTPPEKIVNGVTERVKSGDIILFHDYIASPSPTPDALRKLIPELLAKGYRFVTVSELIGA